LRRLKDVYAAVGVADEGKPQSADDRFVSDFRSAVVARLSDSDLNVEVIAAEMEFSRVQLYRKVRALTGLSPVEIILF